MTCGIKIAFYQMLGRNYLEVFVEDDHIKKLIENYPYVSGEFKPVESYSKRK